MRILLVLLQRKLKVSGLTLLLLFSVMSGKSAKEVILKFLVIPN
jgi:hypothetical protein